MATEEQTQYNASHSLYAGSNLRIGQKLTISNRIVTKLGFWLLKQGSPTGSYYYTIRKVSDDSIIQREVAGDAGDLTTSNVYYEHEFSTPLVVNEEVRISVEWTDGNASNRVRPAYQNSDVKADENLAYYVASWADFGTWDLAYIYTWEEPPAPAGDGGPASLLVAQGVI